MGMGKEFLMDLIFWANKFIVQLRGRYRDFPFISYSLHKRSLLHYHHHSLEWYICYNSYIQPPSNIWLCDPRDCSTPDLSVPHHLLKFAQVHVHCIGDILQPSHPLTSSSPSALNLSQHQGLFQWVSCSHQIGVSASASVFLMSIQGWFPLRLTGLISLLSKGLSGVFSSTVVPRHLFFSTPSSLQSISHNYTWPLGRP